jgi:DNA-directed RNA polymerase specialized sigma24 family protein
MSDGLFDDPAVLKVIRAILVSSGTRAEQDLEDAIREVVLACIEHVRDTGRPPGDVSAAIAIARPIARGDGIDAARKRGRRGRSNQGLTAEADEHAREPQPSLDPVDAERMVAAIRQVLKDEQIEALSDVAAGVPQTELAAESRASVAATRKRTQRARERALGALSARGYWIAGGFTALLAGAIAIYVVSSDDSGRVGTHRPPDEPLDRSRDAAALRDRAADACRDRHWDECERALDLAAQLDADGDRGPDVAALRAAIAAGRAGVIAGDGGARPSVPQPAPKSSKPSL